MAGVLRWNRKGPSRLPELELTLEQRKAADDHDTRETKQNYHVLVNSFNAGVLERQIVKRMHRVSEWIDV